METPTLRPVGTLLQRSNLSEDQNLVEQIHELIRHLIVTVQLLPLQRVSESEISEALGASRTPVREAMIRLTNDGLVKVVPKSGTYVTPINIDRYFEAAYMRILVEVGVAGRAARRWNAEYEASGVLSKPFSALEEALANKDYFNFARSDEEFHFNMFGVAGVPGLWNSIKHGQPDLSRVRHLKRVFKIRRSERVVDEHRAIAEAIYARSEEGAEKAMQAHLGTYEDEAKKLSESPMLVDYITKINEPSERNARTFAANAEFAREMKEHLAFTF
ncbi:GntR family transcriptional regulator [Pacificibacter sp.]|uniref:GntR family transcriptional regulator n=1 Tax=Pacificibacter sp. TaxID=1917866 RepID=UPI003219831F